MELKELKYKINMGLLKFRRAYGKHPDFLILGKNEYATLRETGEDNSEEWSLGSIWNMEIRVDENSDSCIRMIRKIPDFFSYEEDFFSSYRMKIDVVIPLKFKEDFKLFIDKQHNDGVGIQILTVCSNDFKKTNYTRFQLHICGKTKELAITWSNYLFEIERILNHGLKKEDPDRKRYAGLKII